MTFGEKVKNERNRLGLNQDELAKKSALLVELSVPMRMTVPVQEEQNAIRNLLKLSV